MCPQVTFDESTHTYFMDGIKAPSVTEVMPKQAGHSFVSAERMEETSIDGKWRHSLVEQYMIRRNKGENAKTPIEIGLSDFLFVHPEFGKFIGSEVLLWSHFRYAGTADLLFENAVVDVKRTMGAKKYHALQTAGYHRAAVERGKIKTNRNHWILELHDDGTYKAVNVWNELADVMFVSLVKAWWEPDKYRYNVDLSVKNYLNQ